jgi:hypothetical protein
MEKEQMDDNEKWKYVVVDDDPVMELTSIVALPKPTGGYRMGEAACSVTFRFYPKPSWINRFFVKWCLGWVWEDDPTNDDGPVKRRFEKEEKEETQPRV